MANRCSIQVYPILLDISEANEIYPTAELLTQVSEVPLASKHFVY
jgi:hypothetical protein